MAQASSRYLVSAPDQPRVRRAGDVTSILLGGLLLLWAIANRERLGPLNRALAEVVEVLPDWSLEPLSVIYSFGFVYGLTILVLLLASGRSHRDALRDVFLALSIAAVIGVVLVRLLDGSWPYIVPEIGIVVPERQTPVFRIAVTTAMLVAASPHLVRPWRRVGWLIVALSVLAGSGLGFGLPSDAVGAVGVGLIAAGVTFLLVGAPRGLPDLATVAAAMARMGVPVHGLEVPPSRSWGVRRILATAADGAPVLIKAYGRDATDQQLLAKLWRSLWYREERRSFTFSRLESVQHEALLTLWAARAGVSVPEVLTAGAADDEVALLAVSAGGTRLDRLPSEELTEQRLASAWEQVARLHAAEIAHGALDARAVRVLDDGVHLADLHAGTLSATESERARDVVELLFATAVLVGPERAVAAARRGLGDAGLVAALPYLQLPAISGGTRNRATAPKELVRSLAGLLAAALEQPLPEPVELRRVSPRTLLLAVLGIVAALAIIPAVGGIDLAAVAEELSGASWTFILLAFVVGQAVFVTEASSMLFATTATVPFRPLIVLQIAAKFIGVATPGVTGGVASNAAFLSRFGVSPAASLTQGTMDSVAGMLVEVVVLVLAFSFTDLDLGVDLSGTDLALGRLTLLLLVVVAVAVVVVQRLPKLRAPVVAFLSTMWEAIRAVVADPTRAIGVLAGNLGTRLVRGVVLWLALVALDQRIGLGVALVVVIATGLLQAVVPVPGGIGVTEAVMTGFLVALGVPEAAAFAATVTYRFVIFYLPVVQGAAAMVWLTRNDYL
ncbi:MAG: lysylphosphatidylglycerol synthase transmembrane domain-containing protein [Nitriliruptoraceae bacterium]